MNQLRLMSRLVLEDRLKRKDLGRGLSINVAMVVEDSGKVTKNNACKVSMIIDDQKGYYAIYLKE